MCNVDRPAWHVYQCLIVVTESQSHSVVCAVCVLESQAAYLCNAQVDRVVPCVRLSAVSVEDEQEQKDDDDDDNDLQQAKEKRLATRKPPHRRTRSGELTPCTESR